MERDEHVVAGIKHEFGFYGVFVIILLLLKNFPTVHEKSRKEYPRVGT